MLSALRKAFSGKPSRVSSEAELCREPNVDDRHPGPHVGNGKGRDPERQRLLSPQAGSQAIGATHDASRGIDAEQDGQGELATSTGARGITKTRQSLRHVSGQALKSSLDIVFSYSRSQQLYFGSHLPSAPSFVEDDGAYFPARYQGPARLSRDEESDAGNLSGISRGPYLRSPSVTSQQVGPSSARSRNGKDRQSHRRQHQSRAHYNHASKSPSPSPAPSSGSAGVHALDQRPSSSSFGGKHQRDSASRPIDDGTDLSIAEEDESVMSSDYGPSRESSAPPSPSLIGRESIDDQSAALGGIEFEYEIDGTTPSTGQNAERPGASKRQGNSSRRYLNPAMFDQDVFASGRRYHNRGGRRSGDVSPLGDVSPGGDRDRNFDGSTSTPYERTRRPKYGAGIGYGSIPSNARWAFESSRTITPRRASAISTADIGGDGPPAIDSDHRYDSGPTDDDQEDPDRTPIMRTSEIFADEAEPGSANAFLSSSYGQRSISRRSASSRRASRSSAGRPFALTPMSAFKASESDPDHHVLRRRASAMTYETFNDRSSLITRPLSVRSLDGMALGNSTAGQTLFNAVAVLVGIGILAEPLAFAYCGWLLGTGLLIAFGLITNYTAKLLAKIMLEDPNLHGYSDLGIKAFGWKARLWVDVLFCLELFALSIAWVVLFGDSLAAVLGHFSSNTYKIIGFFIIAPTTLLPLHLLSVPSLLSFFSSALLILILIVDGLGKKDAPGSILHPAETFLGPDLNQGRVLGGIGILLAGFGGHAILPSLVRDMREPSKYNRTINLAYIIAGTVFFICGAAGYLMFGRDVTSEVTQDLMRPLYGYSRTLNQVATWLIAVNPVFKFALCTRPLSLTMETILGIGPTAPRKDELLEDAALKQSSPSGMSTIAETAEDQSSKEGDTEDDGPVPVPLTTTGAFAPQIANSLAVAQSYTDAERRKTFWRVLARVVVTAACVITAIILPTFESLMGLLGSLTSFLICIILPLIFYTSLTPKDERSMARDVFHSVVLAISTVMMVAGTGYSLTHV